MNSIATVAFTQPLSPAATNGKLISMDWNQALLHLLLLTTACPAILHAQASPREQIVAHYRQAEAALATGDAGTATREFQAILKLDPSNAEASANLGVIAYKAGAFPQARDLFQEALKHNASLWDAKAFLGLSEMRLGNSRGGDVLLEQAFSHTQNPSVRMEAGIAIIRFHEEDKSLKAAIPVLQDLQGRAPNDPEVLYVAYRVYSDLASESLKTLSQAAPDSGRVHQILAEAAFAQDDFPGAIAQFRQAIQAEPNLPGIHYQLGHALLTNAQDSTARQDAQHEFETALKSDPSDVHSLYELGEIARLNAKPADALAQYRQALRLQPGFADAEVGLGQVLADQGKPQDALTHLEHASRLDPENETAHYRLSRLYRTLGRTGEADTEMALFRKLHEVNEAREPRPATDAKSTPTTP